MNVSPTPNSLSKELKTVTWSDVSNAAKMSIQTSVAVTFVLSSVEYTLFITCSSAVSAE